VSGEVSNKRSRVRIVNHRHVSESSVNKVSEVRNFIRRCNFIASLVSRSNSGVVLGVFKVSVKSILVFSDEVRAGLSCGHGRGSISKSISNDLVESVRRD